MKTYFFDLKLDVETLTGVRSGAVAGKEFLAAANKEVK
jgi:hypothetical protein